MLLFIFVPNVTTIICHHRNVQYFQVFWIKTVSIPSTEYLDNIIKGFPTFPLCDVGRVTYVVLVSDWLYKSHIQIIAHNKRIHGNMMKCSVVKGHKQSRFPSTTRMAS